MNPQVFRHTVLSDACIPISTPWLKYKYFIIVTFHHVRILRQTLIFNLKPMANVNFSPDIDKIIDNLDYSKLGNNVAIKVHFGEKGCTTYIDPNIAKKLYQKIESLGKKATLVECNVLYKGSRTNRTDHIQTALDHGFTEMNIDILDGEKGDEFIEINGCKLGAGLKKYNSLIVLSHFKGHQAAGFGAAIKNVGMGLGSRAGKLHMHSQVKPYIDQDLCIGCGVCAHNCDADAIKIVNQKAQIDHKKCIGCAMCISVCPHNAASIPWESGTDDYLQKMIAQYTAAVLTLFPQAIFINVLKNITELCDCCGLDQKLFMDDIGILSSTDIVAIDQAGLDLANQFSNNQFSQINSINKDNQLKFAKDSNLGDSNYQLTKL